MFRLEIWTNSQMSNEEVDETKEFLKKEFWCPGVIVKDL